MSIISITDKGKTITYHAHHMRGVIDANYRGEVGVILRNMGEQAFEIHEGDRIAQIVFLPYAHMQFEPVNELDSTERGDKGFGSTGR